MKFLASVFGLQKRKVPVTPSFFPRARNFCTFFNHIGASSGCFLGASA